MITLSELRIQPQAARYEPAPEWLTHSPIWPAVQEITGGNLLYRHQAMAMEILGQEQNLIISSGTATGKSLIFQAPTLHRLHLDPKARAIAIYPIKALSRDQLAKWRQMAAAIGLDPRIINKIDGDIEGHQERRELLAQTRLALMTPDIIQAWMMRYSNPPPPRARSPKHQDVMETQDIIRDFLRNLRMLIIDEAHTYDGAIGTACMYLFQRLQHKAALLDPGRSPVQIIAASATIRNPMEHMQTLTGQPFREITEDDNGAPRAELVVQHVLGRNIYGGGWEDIGKIINEILEESPDNRYIAFIDDRQLAERTAAIIEGAKGMTEQEIIQTAEKSMSYRAGLMYREYIEEKLKDGTIRGITSTSAMELGIDIPALNIGMNLGLPTTNQRLRQRAGRVGRQEPGRFMIVADEYALQYNQNQLEDYWQAPVERAKLYVHNPIIRNTHQRCLMMENQGEKSLPPGELLPAIRDIDQGKNYQARFITGNVKRPHQNQVRDATEETATVLQIFPNGDERVLAQDMTIREAFKEAYPLATYYHSKQSYQIERWEAGREGDGPAKRITARQAHPVHTRPIRESGANITLENQPLKIGHMEYSSHEWAETWERIVGCKIKTGPTWANPLEVRYADQGIENIEIRMRTTATTLLIQELWFRREETRQRVAGALRDIMCHREGIHQTDIRTSHENITIHLGPEGQMEENAIVIWDRTGGGLGISQAISEKLLDYTAGLLEIAQDPSIERLDNQKPLDERTALLLHDWATRYTRQREQDGTTRNINKYQEVVFRDRIHVTWAKHFDKAGIPWEYQPCRFGAWQPDFRLEVGGETVYAGIREVTSFPEDTAEEIDWSLWNGTATILGNGPNYHWTRQNGSWPRA